MALAPVPLPPPTRHRHHQEGSIASLLHTMRNPATLIGIGAFAANMAFYTIALRTLDLSIAFPAEGLSLIMVAIFSRVFLKESITPRRWLGTFLVLLGGIFIGID